MNETKIGSFVWHDLFTESAAASTSFYSHIAGWSFVTEHATDFAWGGGEQDFILALLDDEAGAGIATRFDGQRPGWIAYVEVADVDDAANRAKELGGLVERAPFDVPGVGRNCLLRDPMGARIGICRSKHDYPAPKKQFGLERYSSGTLDFSADFYAGLFDWRVGVSSSGGVKVVTLDEEPVAIEATFGDFAVWSPSVRVPDLASALEDVPKNNGTILEQDANGSVLVRDPDGATIYLVT